jgi:hypothetical protein
MVYIVSSVADSLDKLSTVKDEKGEDKWVAT